MEGEEDYSATQSCSPESAIVRLNQEQPRFSKGHCCSFSNEQRLVPFGF